MPLTAEDLEKTHPDYNALEQRRRVCRDLLGGTDAMREAGVEYLPQEEAEEHKDYQRRLDRSFLYNGFAKTVANLTGRVFDHPVSVEGHAKYEEWAANITNSGQDLETFAAQVFKTGVSEGMAFILVDYPVVSEDEGPTDNYDAMKSAARPYMCEIKPQDLYWWWVVNNEGEQVLTEIAWKDTYVDRKTGRRMNQIRTWERGGIWQIWRKPSAAVNTPEQWVISSEGSADPVTEIPLVAIYFGRKTHSLGAEPPLRDLADMNVEHWQSDSDQRHVLHVARVPVLVTKGLMQDGKPQKVVIGVNRSLNLPADGDAFYLEHTGRAIEAGEKDLQKIESRMAAMGISLLLAQRPGDMTATEKAIGKAAEESALQVMAKACKAGLEQAFAFMGAWVPEAVGGAMPVVTMNTEYDMVINDAAELQSIDNDRDRGDISRETMWEEKKRRGIYGKDFTTERENARLDTEPPV